jgi:hypothetical protein
LAQPLVANLGFLTFVIVLMVLLVCSARLASVSRRYEVAADQHAHQHERAEERGTYARVLERLYEENLSPAVMPGKRAPHPHLYDRMVAAGVTPTYERPLPPPRGVRRTLILFAACAAALAPTTCAFILWQRVYRSQPVAEWATVLTGGSSASLAAISYHMEESRFDHATTVLSIVAAHSRLPEYAARLASLLAETDPEAAKRALQRAEQLLSDGLASPGVADTIAELRRSFGGTSRDR